MTVAVVVSRARAGVHAPLVMVEVHFAGGVPAFNLVGLPETDVKESRDRVRAALQNALFEFPSFKMELSRSVPRLPREVDIQILPVSLEFHRAESLHPRLQEVALDPEDRRDLRRIG